ICNRHKSELSSLVLCNVRENCENCRLSLANKTKNKFNDETVRLLVRKAGSNPLQNHDSLSSRICFCCSEQYVSRDSMKKVLPNSPILFHASESLFVNGEHAKSEKNIFVDESRESSKSSSIRNNKIAHASKIEYQKVDVRSDNESEIVVPLKSDSQFEGRDTDEVKWRNDENKEESSQTTEQMSVDEVSPSNNAETRADALLDKINAPITNKDMKDPITESAQSATTNGYQISNHLDLGDIDEVKWRNDENKEESSQITQMSLDEVTPSNNVETRADALLDTINPPIKNEDTKAPVTESEQSATTNGFQISNHLDLGDAYKLAISTKGRQLSGKLLDQKSFKDSSTRVGEDLKILLSHRSNDSMQFLQRRISLERNESNISFDGSVVSEIEGETLVDRLKRQVEHDKKVMGVLYKELEEERNASAVATNQAMAMINRLQEEKAALYTEALQ
ncbi:hypothetical protein M8C21_007587, partial [Ambrosia artemisiifolia]